MLKVFTAEKNDEIILGNAGRLSEEKGQIYLIQLASILKKKGIKFRILIAGAGKTQSLSEKADQASWSTG